MWSSNRKNPFHPSRGPLAAILPLFPRRLQFPIPLGLNLLRMLGERVFRRDVADGAVQTHVVVMVYLILNQTPRIFERQRRSRPDALSFERSVPTFDFAVLFQHGRSDTPLSLGSTRPVFVCLSSTGYWLTRPVARSSVNAPTLESFHLPDCSQAQLATLTKSEEMIL